MSEPVSEMFGRRVQRARAARGWSLRDVASRVDGLQFTMVNRAERAVSDISLSNAVKIADALEIPLGDLLADPECAACDDWPPEGFICAACAKEGRPAS